MVKPLAQEIKLAPRLKQVASYVPLGSVVGDIGTDHAYLPVYLVQQGIVGRAVAVDIHPGPFQSALKTVRERNLDSKICVRLGDGARPLEPGEVNVLTIAGMGGVTILDILLARPEVLDKVTRLVLQPQGAEAKVRRALVCQGWRLFDERLVEEDGRIYTIIAFDKDSGYSPEDLKEKLKKWQTSVETVNEFSDIDEERLVLAIERICWQFGLINLETAGDLLIELISGRISQLNLQIKGMVRSKDPAVISRMGKVILEGKILAMIKNKIENTSGNNRLENNMPRDNEPRDVRDENDSIG